MTAIDHCPGHRERSAQPDTEELFPDAGFRALRHALEQCPRYAPTPLLGHDDSEGRIAGILLKDERARLGLGTFKALGGTWAVLEEVRQALVRRTGERVPADVLPQAAGRFPDLEVITASSGNHGRAVAAGARLAGVACRILLPAATSMSRVAAVEGLGARVERVAADYDEVVAEAGRRAADPGVLYVPDTDVHGATETVARVMTGYGMILDEAVDQARAAGWPAPTHLFVQAGVGGLAGALAVRAARLPEAQRPRLVVVEPAGAAGLMASVRAGRATRRPGPVDSGLTGLDCAEASPLAFRVLSRCADHFIAVPDSAAERSAADLAQSSLAVETTPTGAAGLAGLEAVLDDPALARQLALDRDSMVLAVITETRP